MKLENLKSDRFRTLTKVQLGTVNGGSETIKTQGGSGHFGGIKGLDPGKEYSFSSDCQEFDARGNMVHQEFLIDGVWYMTNY